MPKKDFSQIAFAVVQQAAGEAANPSPNTARQVAGRKGGTKGGPARAIKLDPAKRREIALKAANTRWAKRTSTLRGY
jgi:hypothetical protein